MKAKKTGKALKKGKKLAGGKLQRTALQRRALQRTALQRASGIGDSEA